MFAESICNTHYILLQFVNTIATPAGILRYAQLQQKEIMCPLTGDYKL